MWPCYESVFRGIAPSGLNIGTQNGNPTAQGCIDFDDISLVTIPDSGLPDECRCPPVR
jgi:hypothetical protein